MSPKLLPGDFFDSLLGQWGHYSLHLFIDTLPVTADYLLLLTHVEYVVYMDKTLPVITHRSPEEWF